MTRIYAFTDPHSDPYVGRAIVAACAREKPDLVVCAGDITWFGEHFEEFLRRLSEIGETIYFVPGNHESRAQTHRIVTEHPFMRDVSFTTVKTKKIRIGGLPGNDTAFWPGPTKGEEDVVETAKSIWGDFKTEMPLLFLTHYPPSGTGVSGTSRSSPDSGGSRLVRKIVEAIKPPLVVCGHYHQDFGKEAWLGRTRIVNPGPDGMVLDVD